MANSSSPDTQGKPIPSTGELLKTGKAGKIELAGEDLKRVAGGAVQFQKLLNKESRDDRMQSR
jgi:hypothetical protein